MTQASLAEKIGMAPTTLGRLEAGETEAMWGTVRKVAIALTIPVDALNEMAEQRAAEIEKQSQAK